MVIHWNFVTCRSFLNWFPTEYYPVADVRNKVWYLPKLQGRRSVFSYNVLLKWISMIDVFFHT